jgi:hypothetical protein
MRLNKLKLFTAIILVTIMFLVFQMLIVNYLKSIYNKDSNSEADVRFDNPRFEVLKMRTITATVRDFPTLPILVDVNRPKGNQTNLIAEILVPLEGDKHPSVFRMLPFHHKKNFFDFETTMVSERLVSVSKNDEKRLIRGVNKLKAHLYQPDSQGMFKCLNSNVNVEFLEISPRYIYSNRKL